MKHEIKKIGDRIVKLNGNIFRIRPIADFKDEVLKGNNACAYAFSSRPYADQFGRKFMLWGDYESNEDFISFVQ